MRLASLKNRLWNRESVIPLLFIVLILLFYALFLAHRIDLTIADLGRHLTNGKLALVNPAVWNTNFYSYTAPDYPVMNHHWLAGLFFFLAWRIGGFAGLHLIFIVLALFTLFLFLYPAIKEAGRAPAALIALFALPLLAERTELRPEIFSYLFSGVFFYMLVRYQDRGDWRPLLALPFLEIIWVNSHIYFFLGPMLVAIFLASAAIAKPFNRRRVLPLIWILLAVVAAALFNPAGFVGAAAPFTIFQNYGYRLAENQPVWFIEKILTNPNFTIFKIGFGLLAASFIARAVLSKNNRLLLHHLIPGLTVASLGWLATRNFALFGLFFIPLAAANLAACCKPWLVRYSRGLDAAGLTIISILIVPAFFGQWQRYFPYWRESGIGLESDNTRSIEFFNKQGLTGPIFNNYDIGSYLIWGLFPKERVFTDNRPEAYPAEFFTDTYVPMQEKDEEWAKALEKWRFNAIFFSHRDLTPWGQRFLISRLNDPQWAPVFADRYAIIFLKRNESNEPVIEKFEIPQSAFRVVKR